MSPSQILVRVLSPLLGLLLLAGCAPAVIGGAIALILSSDGGGGGGCKVSGEMVQVTLQGEVRFENRPDGAGVTSFLPVRGARVEVLQMNCGTRELANTSTNDAGEYSVTLSTPSGSTLRVSVLAQSDDADAPTRVLNNESERLIYSIESSNVSLTTDAAQTIVQDIDARIDCQTQIAGAFNILEAARLGFEAIQGVLPPPSIPLHILWELGDPNGTFFSGSNEDLNSDGRRNDVFIQLRGGAFLAGCRDTDQFDDGLILHEFGHYVSSLYSRDDSPGGSHSLAELLDPRLAWSEGWANFFSGFARDNPVLRDSLEDLNRCTGVCGSGDFSIETKHDACAATPRCCTSIASEDAVGAFLWDLFDPPAETGTVDGVEVPREDILQALVNLRSSHFVYVGDYLAEIQFLADRLSPPQGADVLTRAQVDDLDDPFPSAFAVENRSGNTVQASVTGQVNGCDLDTCRQNVESFFGSSDFYELLIPGSPSNTSGRLTATLTITPVSPASCGRELHLRIFNQSQSLVFSTESPMQTGLEKDLSFSFNQNFPRGSFVLLEVAGDTGNGQKANYELTVDVSE